MQSKKFIHKNLCNDVFLHFLHKKEKKPKNCIERGMQFLLMLVVMLSYGYA